MKCVIYFDLSPTTNKNIEIFVFMGLLKFAHIQKISWGKVESAPPPMADRVNEYFRNGGGWDIKFKITTIISISYIWFD